eukprot:gene16566-biopygen6770
MHQQYRTNGSPLHHNASPLPVLARDTTPLPVMVPVARNSHKGSCVAQPLIPRRLMRGGKTRALMEGTAADADRARAQR